MAGASDQTRDLERRALAIGKWANLFMAVAGVVTALLSRSDAMLVDGLYSGVNFVSAIAASRIGARVGGPATRARPWGHDFDEVLYVTFRSLILIGVLIFAAILSGSKILTFLTGGSVPELVFGPIAVYAVVIVAICLYLAVNYHRAYRKSGKRSAILKMEARAALIDGGLSLGSGAVLLSLPFLADTPLGPYTPIGDAVLVLVMVLLIIWQPLASFRATLADLAGVSAPGAKVATVARTARALARENGFKYQRATVFQAGRMHNAAIYVDPLRPVLATAIDRFQEELSSRLETVLGPTRVEVIITARPGPLPRSGP